MSAALDSLPWWINWPLVGGAWVLAFIVGLAAIGALVHVAQQAWHGSFALADWLAGLFAGLTIAAFKGCVALLWMLMGLMWWPVMILWENTAVRAYEGLALKAEALRQRQQLWHHWRREFRDQFRTFAEFMDAFEGRNQQREEPRFQDEPRKDGREQGQRRQQEPPRPPPAPPPAPPPDPQRAAFVAACRLMGLPENGAFTEKELTARYRTLISKAHPDRPGSSGPATEINVARALIKQRKGWT